MDYILAVKVVDSVDEAIAHIAQHSTGHSEAILTQTQADADRFTAAVDSAAVYVNCSTRFTDGGEFGLGCEMGISTQKLHARGPMGLEELCSYKYVIHGDGRFADLPCPGFFIIFLQFCPACGRGRASFSQLKKISCTAMQAASACIFVLPGWTVF